MLDDDAYQRWLDQCEFSDPACTLLTNIRRSPPVRRVAGGRGNIHGRYPSRKMGMTIQFESHTELGAIYVMEHDPAVLEFYDQPTKLKLHYIGPSGRRVTNWLRLLALAMIRPLSCGEWVHSPSTAYFLWERKTIVIIVSFLQ